MGPFGIAPTYLSSSDHNASYQRSFSIADARDAIGKSVTSFQSIGS